MNLKDKILNCKRCGHEWLSRKKDIKNVRQCPKCKSAWWDTEKNKKEITK
jgi:predicted Zn-ribbon and HTH transcriptional regulator